MLKIGGRLQTEEVEQTSNRRWQAERRPGSQRRRESGVDRGGESRTSSESKTRGWSRAVAGPAAAERIHVGPADRRCLTREEGESAAGERERGRRGAGGWFHDGGGVGSMAGGG
jgi:hypothetical protein